MSKIVKEFEITVLPGKDNDLEIIKQEISKKYKIPTNELEGIFITKKSLDARTSPKYIIKCSLDNKFKQLSFQPQTIHNAQPILIIGAGPAGLFTALRLIELGLKPIIIERGKAVRDRRKDLANLMKQGILNTDSNYCFGEGGAGTFSDGKLYTRSNKRGSIQKVLDIFVEFGAQSNIRFDAHPHIGTNKLPQIISSITKTIRDCGGEVHFSTKLLEIKHENGHLTGAVTTAGFFTVKNLVLATGHSARDVFELLYSGNIKIEAKSFALGVRIEHPQELINRIQYKNSFKSPHLPPASYALSTQNLGTGVYTFCMCPGGIICPASTNQGEVVVNGWSPSTRGSRFANSGLVVEIKKENLKQTGKVDEFKCLDFQTNIERKAFEIGGGKFKAPAQRVTNFISNSNSTTLPTTSYKPGITSSNLKEILPDFISTRLQNALKEFIKKNPLYGSEEAILVGVESRTSSPVKIPRNELGMHPEISGLFPCGEGAGYAGGIVSAAMDGIKIAELVKYRGAQ